MTRAEIQMQLQAAFAQYLGASATVTQQLIPQSVSNGKLYEAYILSQVLEKLSVQEGFSLLLVGGTKIQLKSSPGPINRNYPRVELRAGGNCAAELWTDVEFISMSYCRRANAALTNGDYHELDILIVDAGVAGRPRFDQVWLGVECKNTGYKKGFLKEILGVRRELSLLSYSRPTRFTVWPRADIPANPASCLLVYSTDADVLNYAAPGDMFGIDFVYEAM